MSIHNRLSVKNKVLIVLMLILSSLLLISCGKEKKENIQNDSEEKANKISELKIENTKEFDDDRLYFITDVEYTGPDFDGDDKEIKERSCITVRNDSGEYLRSAKIQVEMDGNDKAEAYIECLPADMETVAVLHGVDGYVPQKSYTVVKCESKYEKETQYFIEGLCITMDMSDITIYNGSDRDLTGCTLKYKGKIADTLIGGYAKEIKPESFKPGESFSFINSYAMSGAEGIEIVEILD